MSPYDLENSITKKTKCYSVHMLGSARMDKIMKISKKYKIPVIEDACNLLAQISRETCWYHW